MTIHRRRKRLARCKRRTSRKLPGRAATARRTTAARVTASATAMAWSVTLPFVTAQIATITLMLLLSLCRVVVRQKNHQRPRKDASQPSSLFNESSHNCSEDD